MTLRSDDIGGLMSERRRAHPDRVENSVSAVAVVVVTYNSARHLKKCLDSLVVGLQGVRTVAVIVADNSSSDETLSIARRQTGLPIRIVELGRNAGFAAGINAAVATLEDDKVDAVLVLNPDAALRPGSVAVLADALGVPGRAIVVPRLINPDGTLQTSLRHRPTLLRAVAEALVGGTNAARVGWLGELIAKPAYYDRAGRFAWATGAAMLLSTEALRVLGPWDESFLLYSEETEFALRAADHGWVLWYEPRAVVEHVGGSHKDPVLGALLEVNRVRLFKRHHGPLSGLAFHAVVVVGVALRAALGRRTARASLIALLRPSRRQRVLPG